MGQGIQKQVSLTQKLLPIALTIPIEARAKQINTPMTIRTIIYVASILVSYVLKIN